MALRTHGPSRPRGQRGGGLPRGEGGIRKRSPAPPRVDRDGDLDMDAPEPRGRGRGAPRAPRGNPFSRASVRGGPGPGRHNTTNASRGSGRHGGINAEAALKEAQRRDPGFPEEKLVVQGWKESKAASNPGGGVAELLKWLARKAAGPHAAPIHMRQHHVTAAGTLFVLVKPDDVNSVLRLNGYDFAGAQLKVERPHSDAGPKTAEPNNTKAAEPGLNSTQIKEKMTAMLNRRYDPATKLLDLTKLGADPEFANTGMFGSQSTQSKFFPALMTVCSGLFKTDAEKREAVVSVTLADNNIPNVKTVNDLSYTLPDIRNLDLSGNNFADLDALGPWRRRFKKLDHLILSNNPLEANVPDYPQQVTKWYRTLRTLNNVPVRTDADVAIALQSKFPVSIKAPVFKGGPVGEDFIKHFFPAYDHDRPALINAFYDATSRFSLSVNTAAPRGKEQSAVAWDRYIKQSRNLTKLTHLAARRAREYTGPERIREAWAQLPPTRHPDLVAESAKWCLESNQIAGLPAPAGGQQQPGGDNLGGLIIVVHGEYTELDPATGQTGQRCSFDRTFVLGPGAGLGGIRVANDIMVVRAPGGHDAWRAEEDAVAAPQQQPQQPLVQQQPTPQPLAPQQQPAPQPALQQPAPNHAAQPNLPEGYGVAGPGKSAEDAQKELLALELSKATRLTLQYSVMCLDQVAWNLELAGKAFDEVKATLPAEAFF